MRFLPWTRLSSKSDGKPAERIIYINEPEKNAEFKYANNYIKTSKYNLINFLPKNLFEQFRRLANFYFLCLVVLQLIPAISSLNPITTIIPLITVILISALKDAVDDVQRHMNDNSVNSRKSLVLHALPAATFRRTSDGGEDGIKNIREKRWDKVEVGDIIRLESDQFVTADLLVLSSSEPNGLCYIETAELDGETNLKSRECLSETAEFLKDDDEAISSLKNCRITCEAPNDVLDRFQGQLQWAPDGGETKTFSLTNNQILLRGCALRNTKWCYGVVVFAGRDTKLMQNSGKTVLKRTRVDRLLNVLILGIVFLLLAMCSLLTVLRGFWEMNYGQYFRVFVPWAVYDNSSIVQSIGLISLLVFFSYIILLNSLVPISLYVSIEMIRFVQSMYINWDREMCHEDKQFAKARTTTLNEELGQIEYIFSDKTGTLTQNIMILLKMSISGTVYGDLFNENGESILSPPADDAKDGQYTPIDFAEKLCPKYTDPSFKFYDIKLADAVLGGEENSHLFFKLLALCHTVMPEDKDGTLVYQAQSPDEEALCKAARNFGFVFTARTPNSITLDVHGESVMYEILCILDFNNVRKRMSVVVRDPRTQEITLYCKGADSVILERLDDSEEQQQVKAQTSEHLHHFAAEGLRTLCLAYKPLDAQEYAAWSEEYHEASVSMKNREERMDECMEKLETNLLLAGATAIEDKLQDGVPQAIATLLKSGLRLWVLTGDKQETAINIGYSCNLLTDEMRQVFIVNGETAEEVQQQLEKASDDFVKYESEKPAGIETGVAQDQVVLSAEGGYALVVNGSSLKHALEAAMEELFLRVATQCRTVICCRVTPLQKALVIELVKRRKGAVTLAIGDGANDVGMIKAAHIGVGISGQEGRQAVLASDYSLAQFRFLQRLLLVHGRWSYFRVSKFMRYFFYKNFTFALCHLWFAFFCGYSAQTIFDPWFVAFYNLCYTSLPVLMLGIFEQDVNDINSQKFPRLYADGLRMAFFNKTTFLRTALHGILTSLVLFFTLFAGFYHDTELYNFQAFSFGIATNLILVVTLQVCVDAMYWTFYNVFTVVGSVAFYFAMQFIIYNFFWPPHWQSSYAGTMLILYTKPIYWLTFVLTAVILIAPVIGWRFLQADIWPTLADRVRWQQLRGTARVHVEDALDRRRDDKAASFQRQPSSGARQSTRRRQENAAVRSSYAFSHEVGFGRLITSGLNMRNASAGLRANISKNLVKLAVAIAPRTSGTGARKAEMQDGIANGSVKITATGALGLHAASTMAVVQNTARDRRSRSVDRLDHDRVATSRRGSSVEQPLRSFSNEDKVGALATSDGSSLTASQPHGGLHFVVTPEQHRRHASRRHNRNSNSSDEDDDADKEEPETKL